MNRNLYAILQIERGASACEIRSAYRRLAHKFHPDHNAAEDASDRFRAIAEAYGVLSDTSRRAAYDQWGHVPSAAVATLRDEETAFE